MPWFLLNVDSSCLQMDGLIDLCAVVSQARKLTATQPPRRIGRAHRPGLVPGED